MATVDDFGSEFVRRAKLGERPVVRIRVENVGEEPIRFVFGSAGSANLGILNIDYEERNRFGQRARRRFTRVMKRKGEQVLEPGTHWEMTVELPQVGGSKGEAVSASVFRRYVVWGKLRPFIIEKGGQRLSRFLMLSPLELKLIDEGHKVLASDSLGKTRELLKRLKGEENLRVLHGLQDRLFFATQLVPRSAERDLVDLLVRSLPDFPGSTGELIMVLLSYLSGESLHPDRDWWLRWWESRKS